MFGIRPWEWDEMTVSEVLGLCDYIDRREEAMKNQGA